MLDKYSFSLFPHHPCLWVYFTLESPEATTSHFPTLAPWSSGRSWGEGRLTGWNDVPATDGEGLCLLQMISAEAPVLFAKAAQIFITELTLRAWIHTEDNKRRTLQVTLWTDIGKTGQATTFACFSRMALDWRLFCLRPLPSWYV